MALRGIEDTFSIRFDPRKEFSCSIPQGFLEYETDTKRIERIWIDFLSSMSQVCKSRQALFQNKHFKKNIFLSAMEKLCKDFSMRTESVKVSFEYRKLGKEKIYLLKFTKLTEIPEFCRNIQFCVAEIPPTEMQAYAQFVSMADVDTRDRYNPEVRVEAVLDVSNGNSSEVNNAQTTSVEDWGTTASSIRSMSTITSQPLQNQQRQEANHEYDINPPIAIAVAEETMEVSVPTERSAFERMQELESIKCYLTEIEFSTKRQAILDSIWKFYETKIKYALFRGNRMSPIATIKKLKTLFWTHVAPPDKKQTALLVDLVS